MQAEKRKERRAKRNETIFISSDSKVEWLQEMPALCIDENKYGLGIFTVVPLTEGLEINVKLSLTSLVSSYYKATVMWCQEVGKDLYTAGISFNYRSA